MQIKALRGTFGSYGSVRRGQIVDVSDTQAQQLVKRGLFVPVQDKEAAKAAPARPSSAASKSPTGGPTGEAKPSSSSRAGQASKTSRSTKSKGGRE